MPTKLRVFVTTPQKIRAPDCRTHAEGQVNYAFNWEVDGFRSLDELMEALKYGPVAGDRLIADKNDRRRGIFVIDRRSRQVVNTHGYVYMQEPDMQFIEGEERAKERSR